MINGTSQGILQAPLRDGAAYLEVVEQVEEVVVPLIKVAEEASILKVILDLSVNDCYAISEVPLQFRIVCQLSSHVTGSRSSRED